VGDNNADRATSVHLGDEGGTEGCFSDGNGDFYSILTLPPSSNNDG